MPLILGRCPACGQGGTLDLDDSHRITCYANGCPDILLVHDFLSGVMGPARHIAQISTGGWHLEHTLRCRLDGMAKCLIHRALSRFDRDGILLDEVSATVLEPIDGLGRYEVEMHGGALTFHAVGPG